MTREAATGIDFLKPVCRQVLPQFKTSTEFIV